MSDNFIDYYQRAIASYTEYDYAEFFRLSGIFDRHMQSIGKDFLGVAGGVYLSHIDRQEAAPTRSETIKQLSRAQRASRDLADSLSQAMADISLSSALAGAGSEAGRALKSSTEPHTDTLAILSAIFPVEADGKGFRYEGFQKSLALIADSIGQIEADAIKKNKRGRGIALHPWLVLMCMYWAEAKGELPRIGHYEKDIGDYDSADVAALTFAAERLDKELTGRLIVSTLNTTLRALESDFLEAIVLMGVGFTEIITAGVSVSGKDALQKWLAMPQDITDELWASGPTLPNDPKEHAKISKEEFRETLKSSEGGRMLLQAAMAMRRE